MEYETIIVAGMSLLGTLIGSFGGMRVMSYRLEQLEKKVDKHNNFAERIPVIENRMKVCEHRLWRMKNESKYSRRT